jgi:hypothetical protein
LILACITLSEQLKHHQPESTRDRQRMSADTIGASATNTYVTAIASRRSITVYLDRSRAINSVTSQLRHSHQSSETSIRSRRASQDLPHRVGQ